MWFTYNQFWPTEAFTSSYHTIFQLILPIFFIIFGWKWLWSEGKSIDEITPPDLECQELQDSIKTAKETIGSFIPEAEKGVEGAFVKFPITGDLGNTEHIWGYVHFFKDDYFNVSLANEPMDPSINPDGRLNIKLDEIEDWQLVLEDGNIKGGFSLIALFKYHERMGVKLSPLMKKQKAQLLDYPSVN